VSSASGLAGQCRSDLRAISPSSSSTDLPELAVADREWKDERIVPLSLDITDPASIAAAVAAAPDVTVLINNAGVSVPTPGILSHTDNEIRANVETNILGPLFLTRASASILSAHTNSVLIDIHSALIWFAVAGIYSATKAALWSVTNSLRLELAPAGVDVVGVHVGYVDTAMAPRPPKRRPLRPTSSAASSTLCREATMRYSPTPLPCSSRQP